MGEIYGLLGVCFHYLVVMIVMVVLRAIGIRSYEVICHIYTEKQLLTFQITYSTYLVLGLGPTYAHLSAQCRCATVIDNGEGRPVLLLLHHHHKNGTHSGRVCLFVCLIERDNGERDLILLLVHDLQLKAAGKQGQTIETLGGNKWMLQRLV